MRKIHEKSLIFWESPRAPARHIFCNRNRKFCSGENQITLLNLKRSPSDRLVTFKLFIYVIIQHHIWEICLHKNKRICLCVGGLWWTLIFFHVNVWCGDDVYNSKCMIFAEIAEVDWMAICESFSDFQFRNVEEFLSRMFIEISPDFLVLEDDVSWSIFVHLLENKNSVFFLPLKSDNNNFSRVLKIENLLVFELFSFVYIILWFRILLGIVWGVRYRFLHMNLTMNSPDDSRPPMIPHSTSISAAVKRISTS